MTTVIVKPRNKEEKNLLTQLLRKMNVKSEVIEDDSPNEETRKAMEDVENKKGTRVKDSTELFNKLGI